MERLEIKLSVSKKPTDVQIRKIQEHFAEMPIEEILAGLNFARNRWTAKDAGVLKVGIHFVKQKSYVGNMFLPAY